MSTVSTGPGFRRQAKINDVSSKGDDSFWETDMFSSITSAYRAGAKLRVG